MYLQIVVLYMNILISNILFTLKYFYFVLLLTYYLQLLKKGEFKTNDINSIKLKI